MSISVSSQTFGPAAPRFAVLRDAWGRLHRTVASCRKDFARRQRMASMRAFAAGDERELKDLGISRAQAHYVAERPVWGRSPALATDPDCA